ncbi:protein N-terminal asparagine amidohydrolase [Heracleum sosnowskyi]|uniref:Protein N-terminal asparagine amidohydrolase n=1 Tax=Heracleum sosnowskyi TaxID=360622 RepID=A0AAD8JES8_9APIA|nr:protein N-terminal asparagine amidohydrolase [Heracleum sosnowskyi]
MIYVDGLPLSPHSSSSSSSQDDDALAVLMKHPTLVSVSDSFGAISERKFSASEESNVERSTSKAVYVFQREYATVDPAHVDLVGTDEATTCLGIVIRNRRNGMTSVTHMDSPDVVDIGFTQMLSLALKHDVDDIFDVHLVGAFNDSSPQSTTHGTKSKKQTNLGGYSFPLCQKIIQTLEKSSINFHIQLLHVLDHNTRWDSQGNAYPIFHGFLVEPSTGLVNPASFDKTSRCPDEILRRIRLTASFEDSSCAGRLLETYDTLTDQIIISPFSWTRRQISVAFMLRHLSDSEILLSCSTSPSAEGPDFVENQRRQCEYVIEHPDFRKVFPLNQPHVFERTPNGGWRRLQQ